MKQLLKKIAKNGVVRDAFRSFLVENKMIEQQVIENEMQYITDLMLLNVLDQIWIQNVYEPNIKTLVYAMEKEIFKCHYNSEALFELIRKRPTLLKICKLIKATEIN